MALKKIRGLGRGMKYPGRLIVVEGCDGSGKSTQLHLVRVWLEQQGYPVFFTEWNSSDIVNTAIRRAKKKNLLTPTTFSLIHACDFADRYEKVMLPPLRAGYIVLADRYVYTAYARDFARGCDPDWVRNLYSFAVKPSLALYFKAPLDVSVARILTGRPALKYHEAGMDLGLSPDPVESFKLFQGIIKDQYDKMVKEENFCVIDSTRSILDMQKEVRKIVAARLAHYAPPPDSVPGLILPHPLEPSAPGGWIDDDTEFLAPDPGMNGHEDDDDPNTDAVPLWSGSSGSLKAASAASKKEKGGKDK